MFVYKLKQMGMRVQKEVSMPLTFEEIKIDCGYRADIIVENKLLIELKSVAEMHDIYLAQTLTYLRVGKFKLGLLINFNVILLKDGIRRVVNGL